MSKILILTEKRQTGYELASTLDDDNISNDIEELKKQSKQNGKIEGDNYIITWAMGHLYKQKSPKEIDEKYGLYQKLETNEAYKLKKLKQQITKEPDTNKNKQYQLKIIKKELTRLDIKEIIIATDADAEGETIARDMIFLTNPNIKVPIKRFWNTGSYKAKEAVDKAMQNMLPYDHAKYETLYHSQKARSECDYLIGMKLTKVAVDYYNKPFYIGRVKGVITSLIGNREEEIKNFKSSPYWKLFAKKGSLELTHYFMEDTGENNEDGTPKTVKQTSYYKNEEIKVVKEKLEAAKLEVTVEKFTTEKSISKSRPLPLSGTDFATEMMGKHKISYTQCNDILQYLRDEGFTTYQGTNGRYFAQEDRVDVEASLNTLNSYFKRDLPFTTDTYIFNDKKASKQNHPPLSVTTKVPTEQDLSIWENNKLPNLKEAYELIAKRIMVAFLEDDELEKQHLVVASADGYMFELTGRKALKQGWRSFLNEEIKDSTFESEDTLEIGSTLTLDSIDSKESMTKSPLLYNTKTLLSTLLNVSKVIDHTIQELDDLEQIKKYKEIKKLLKDAEGIGTDRTREGIINDLIENEIIVADKKDSLTLTDRGLELFKVYPDALKSIVLTATWENNFEQIRQGVKTYEDFIDEVDTIIMEDMIPGIIKNVGVNVQVKPQSTSKKEVVEGVTCPLCKSELYDTGKTFKCSKNLYIDGKQKGCKFSIFIDQSKSLGRKLAYTDLNSLFESTNKKNPLKEEKHSIYYDPSNKYFLATVWNNEDSSSPDCKDLTETPKTFKKGSKFVFKEVRGKALTPTQAENLLDGKEIVLTRKSKLGKNYKIKATLKENGGIDAEFIPDS